tara:strand:+ start:5454 stop:5897 length:444 start_codon:yes stop_codon:yes gene_type:complete
MADLNRIEQRVIEVDGKVVDATNDIIQVSQNLGVLTQSLESSIAALQQQVTAVNAIVTDPVAGVEPTPYIIQNGYNMFGYTGTNGIPLADAFIQASGIPNIMDQLGVIKDQSGNFFYDGIPYSLSTLVYGRGYFLRNLGPAFSVTWA